MSGSAAKTYDRDYFDKWYRGTEWRAGSRGELKRKVALAVALAEYYLGREIHTVLDVGCGEAPWRAPLHRLRPGIDYLGLDSSDYVVSRYGRSRGIRLARFGELDQLRFDRPFDLIVCSDVLHYLRASEIRRGLRGFAELLQGLAFLELYTSRDRVSGDKHGFIRRSPAWYLAAFRDAGLTPCGSHAYLGPRLLRSACALEVSTA